MQLFRELAVCKKEHKKALLLLHSFWSLLLLDVVDMTKAERLVHEVVESQRTAMFAYHALLEHNPNVPRVLRSWGRFQEEVLNDTAAAEEQYRRAADLEDADMKKRTHEMSSLPFSCSRLPSLIFSLLSVFIC